MFIEPKGNFLDSFRKSLISKHVNLSEYSNWILSFIFFSKYHFLIVPYIYSDWYLMLSRFFFLTQRFRLGAPFRYLENVHKVHRKFSREFWKNVSTQIMRNKWSPLLVCNMLTKPHILSWNFFQRFLENFLWTLWICSTYLKGPLDPISASI